MLISVFFDILDELDEHPVVQIFATAALRSVDAFFKQFQQILANRSVVLILAHEGKVG